MGQARDKQDATVREEAVSQAMSWGRPELDPAAVAGNKPE